MPFSTGLVIFHKISDGLDSSLDNEVSKAFLTDCMRKPLINDFQPPNFQHVSVENCSEISTHFSSVLKK